MADPRMTVAQPSFDLSALRARMPALRGRLLANQPLAEFTWFRVGGLARVYCIPEDEDDLAYALAHLSADIPVTVIGLGSNLIVARRRGGRGDPPRPWLQRRDGGGGASPARGHRCAGREGRARRAEARYPQYIVQMLEDNYSPRTDTVGGFNLGFNFTYFQRKNVVNYGIEVLGYQTSF